MSRSRSKKPYRQPSKEESRKILFIGYDLGELFGPELIEEFALEARSSAVGVFYAADEDNPRYRPGNGQSMKRRTDNYIIGVGQRPSDLARHIASKTRRQIIPADELHPMLGSELAPVYVNTIIQRAKYDIILLALNTMISRKEIWYDEATGVWSVLQSAVDNYVAERKFRRALGRSLKRDDRTYHGRNRSQSMRRGVPEGASISYA